MEKLNNEKQRDYTIEDLEELLDNIPFEVWIKDYKGAKGTIISKRNSPLHIRAKRE